ncbi:hypothetical protein QJQ45_003080 [Haematococcus lacustris]|nr:hypothetical protein QJQ45_003080 [Haematococcus lacustris]
MAKKKRKGSDKKRKASRSAQGKQRQDRRDGWATRQRQRIGESRWRPLELCFWPDQGALPAKGKEYPGLGYKRLRDKPPKAQEQQQQPAEAQWLRPVYSEAKRSFVRGLMSSTSYNIRFYDRDVSAALNIRRCAVGPGPRPTELCYWDGRPAMPKLGRPGQEWVYLRDKALLRCIAANAGCLTTTQPAMRAGAMRAVMHRLGARQQDARTLARVAYGTAQDVQMGQEKCFADFAIYKGKGAVQMKPVPPSWSRTDGPRGPKLVLSREGVLMMEFANVMQGQSDYDLTGRPSDAGVEFFHDSGKSNAAQAGITKRLKLIYGQDLSSMLLTVTQSNAQENKNTQVTVPITRAEFVVIKALANHLIPRLLGFDVVLSDSFAS